MKNVIRLSFFIFLLFGFLFSIKAQAPSAPSNLTVQEGNWQSFVFVKLNWDYIGGQDSHVRFNIYRKTGAVSDTGSFELKYSYVEDTHWIDKHVTHGLTYSYYVTAVNRDGESGPSDTAEITIDSALARGTVKGIVKDAVSGNAIYDASVYFYPVFGWDCVKAETDSSGNYSVDLYPGNYIVYTRAEGYLPQFYDATSNIFHSTKINVTSSDTLAVNFDLQLKPVLKFYTLSGTVQDTLGNGLKALIEVKNVAYNSYWKKYAHTVTDDSGKYSIKVLQGDTVVVFARSFNHQYVPQFYNNKSTYLDADRIGISGDTANINFVLQHKAVPNNSVSGTIEATDSTNVTGIVIAVRLGSTERFRRKYVEMTDSVGNYSFTHISPGTYIFLAIPEGEYNPTFYRVDGQTTLRWKMADSVLVDSNSAITGINFWVSPESDSGADFVSGNVSDNNGNSVPGAMVFAVNSNQGISGFAITDRNGNYVIPGLVPGSYTIQSDLYGYTSAQPSNVNLDYTANYSGSASFVLSPEGVTGVESSPSSLPKTFKLNQNYPNPFNPSTVISYSLPTNSFVSIKVYDIIGREVATLVNNNMTAGNHQITFDAAGLTSGVYLYQIRAGNFVQTKKMILLK